MSDTTVVNKLDVIDTLKEGVSNGFKNIVPILVNALLSALTGWIPYFGVGVLIGFWVGVVAKVSKGEVISPTEVFNPKYRKYMGEFFLTCGLIYAGVVIGLVLGLIPGIVIALAWSLALLLVIDKGKNPTEALILSNNCTYGNKWRMVGVYFLVGIAFSIVGGILIKVAMLIPFPLLTLVIVLALYVVYATLIVGINASFYKRLAGNV